MPNLPIFTPLLIVIAVTGFVGVINGLVVSKLHVPVFLLASGMQIIIYSVNVVLSKVKIFGLAVALYGLAGFLLAAKTGSVGPASGRGYEFETIASATIGGFSTAGGEGSVLGILLDVFFLELLKLPLADLGILIDVINIVQGIIIIIADALDVRKKMMRR